MTSTKSTVTLLLNIYNTWPSIALFPDPSFLLPVFRHHGFKNMAKRDCQCFWVHNFHCSPSAGAQHRPQRSVSTGNAINTSSLPYIEVLRGRDGRDGRDGVPGPHGPQGQRGEQGVAGPPGPRNGGVVYTRWGKTSCPNITGTELVYAGRAGGSWFRHTGGGANYLCMPNDPDYLQWQSNDPS